LHLLLGGATVFIAAAVVVVGLLTTNVNLSDMWHTDVALLAAQLIVIFFGEILEKNIDSGLRLYRSLARFRCLTNLRN
jgi:hypothetical protein